VSLLAKAGFDPHAMPVFLDRLQRASRLYETGAPTYMRSHPVTYERVADVQNRVFDLPYRQVPDSLEFHLVRAKLRAEQGDPRDAVTTFDEQVRERKFANETAAHYGLAVALIRAKDMKRAAVEIEAMQRAGIESGMQASLVGRFRTAQGDRAGALAWYASQIKTWPQHRGMVYAYAAALIDAGRAGEAVDVLDVAMLKDQEDGRLYELQAKAYSTLGKAALQHRSLAEASIAAGNLPLAIEHLQIALNAGGGDFYTLSTIEARLRELKALQPPR
jgi:beta-barrel assembly-enhancing protease